ncbi:MAG: THUMP domain-containing class I SAM-dependent RNA methyltransferase [bacterium]|jgi:putative N6-adenine-specific DNA methylase
MEKFQLIATATFGLEAIVAREVRDLGYHDVKVENGKVTFSADEAGICRANIWLRSADRVLIKIGEFPALSFDELFERTKALPWTRWLPEDANFPVSGKSIKSKLFSVPDCQAIVKKAIVEKMKQQYRRQRFAETGSRYAIEIALLKDNATVTIDSSGQGLHKRGYRKLTSNAPLKETLAAAMVNLTNWKPDQLLIDPFCGSGTIPIEAALIALNIAPGLYRKFSAESWPNIPSTLWKRAREEARDLIRHNLTLKIRGTDLDNEVLKMARYHARSAGVEGHIHWQQQPVSQLQTRQKYGFLITNPPYGERLEDRKSVERLYRQLGQVCNKLDTWSFYFLTSHPDFEKLFGRIASKKRKLYNGRIQCNYYQFFGPRPPRSAGKQDNSEL